MPPMSDPAVPLIAEVTVRKAYVDNVERIHSLIARFSEKQLMLARSRSELYESVRDFFVAEASDGAVIACGGLEIVWSDLAELKSLAVDSAWQGRSVGRRIVEACLAEARSLHITRVFSLTYQTAFFEKMGFRTIPKEELPHKIWSDCLKCPKFPDCDEVAMAIDLPRGG
jgi:amino-acid N-acetyltransferase